MVTLVTLSILCFSEIHRMLFTNFHNILVNFQWNRSADSSKEVPATFGSEALKEVPGSEAL